MLPPKRSTRTSVSLKKEIKEAVQADANIVKLENSIVSEEAGQVSIDSELEALPEHTINISPEKGDTTIPKKARRKLTTVQRSGLEALAEQTVNPTLEARRALADQLGLDLKVVSVWFQNKRRHLPKSPETETSASVDVGKALQEREPFQNVNRDINIGKQDKVTVQKGVSSSPLLQNPLSCPPRTMNKLWELLPSSPSPRGNEQSESLSSLSPIETPDAGKKPYVSSKRPSLEWACNNEERKVKRMRKSLPLFSGVDPSIGKEAGFPVHTRRRTDFKPLHPSPRVHQSPVKKRTTSLASSHFFDEGPHFDIDALEVALTLVRMKRQSIGA